MTRRYQPEIDLSQVLEPELASWYQQLIGILRWAVELGRVNIRYTGRGINDVFTPVPAKDWTLGSSV
jgi:hypothetical protein